MTASQIPLEPGVFITPVVDYEPPPLGSPACPAPTSTALHRVPRRPLRIVEATEATPPRAAAVFADAVLRRVLEVIDRRRSLAQLRPMLAPPLLDTVFGLVGTAAADKAAVLRRVRLRGADGHRAAEVFATYTRGPRVRAIAARIEIKEGRWHLVALQVG